MADAAIALIRTAHQPTTPDSEQTEKLILDLVEDKMLSEIIPQAISDLTRDYGFKVQKANPNDDP